MQYNRLFSDYTKINFYLSANKHNSKLVKTFNVAVGKYQRWSRGHKAQSQGHTKKSEAKHSPSEDRPSRSQEQECSRPRPRTQAQVFSEKKKVFKKMFQAFFSKKRLLKFFSGNLQNFNNSKKVLSSSLRT